MGGLCQANGFILGLPSDQGRKGCPWLLKIHSPRPDRFKVINSCLPQTAVGKQLTTESRNGGGVRNLC